MWIDWLITGTTWLKNKTKIKLRVKTVKTILWSFLSSKTLFLDQTIVSVNLLQEWKKQDRSNRVSPCQGKKMFKARAKSGRFQKKVRKNWSYLTWLIPLKAGWWKHLGSFFLDEEGKFVENEKFLMKEWKVQLWNEACSRHYAWHFVLYFGQGNFY